MLESYAGILERIGKRERFKKQSVLFFEGDMPSALIYLLQGTLKLYKSDSVGNEVVIHYLRAPCFVAEMPLFEGIPYPASAVFESNGEILSVNFNHFKQEMMKNQELNLSLIASLMDKIKVLEKKITLLSSPSLQSRLAQFLLDSTPRLANLTQSHIAKELNTNPQSLSRAIKVLKNQGILSTHKGKIAIQDTKALGALV